MLFEGGQIMRSKLFSAVALLCTLVVLAGCGGPKQEEFLADEPLIAYMCATGPESSPNSSICLSTLTGNYGEVVPVQLDTYRGTSSYDTEKQININDQREILFDCEVHSYQLCHYSVATQQMGRLGIDHPATSEPGLNNQGEIAYVCYDANAPSDPTKRKVCWSNVVQSDPTAPQYAFVSEANYVVNDLADPQITENSWIGYLCYESGDPDVTDLCVSRPDGSEHQVVLQDESLRAFAINNNGQIIYNCEIAFCLTDLDGTLDQRVEHEFEWLVDEEAVKDAMAELAIEINDNGSFVISLGPGNLYMGSIDGDTLTEIDTRNFHPLCCPKINNGGWIVYSCFSDYILNPHLCSRDPENGRIHKIAVEGTHRSSRWGLSVNR